VLDWLEVPENFRLITGGAQQHAKGVQAGLKLKKVDAYKQLGDYINAKFHTKWDVKNSQAHFRALFKKDRDTRKAYKDVQKVCMDCARNQAGVYD
jgi:hypothetical protein